VTFDPAVVYRAFGVPDILRDENKPKAAARRIMETLRVESRDYAVVEPLCLRAVAAVMQATAAGALDALFGGYSEHGANAEVTAAQVRHAAITFVINASENLAANDSTKAAETRWAACEVAVDRVHAFVARYPFGFTPPVIDFGGKPS